jgi:flap endonuclease-1
MGTAIGDLIERQEITLDFLKGKTIAIDSYNILYQFLSSIRGVDGTPLMDSHGKITSHLTGLLYRTTNLLEKGIKPVFVFDGKPHELKKKTLEARNLIRTSASLKMKDAQAVGNLEEAKKFAQQSSKLTLEMVEEAKKLVSFMGLPIVQAPSEGEAQIAKMVQENTVFAGVSQDYDCLLFGVPRLCRNLTVSGKRKLPGKNVFIEVKPEYLELEKVLSQLKIDRQKLIWIGLLIGTDFNEKFPKIGPKTALKLVQEHNSFEEIIAATKAEPKFDYKEIERIFLNPNATSGYKISFIKPDIAAATDFLVQEHDFSHDRVETALKKITDIVSDTKKQSTLGAWS